MCKCNEKSDLDLIWDWVVEQWTWSVPLWKKSSYSVRWCAVACVYLQMSLAGYLDNLVISWWYLLLQYIDCNLILHGWTGFTDFYWLNIFLSLFFFFPEPHHWAFHHADQPSTCCEIIPPNPEAQLHIRIFVNMEQIKLFSSTLVNLAFSLSLSLHKATPLDLLFPVVTVDTQRLTKMRSQSREWYINDP